MERITVVRAIIDGLIERINVTQEKDPTPTKRNATIQSYGTAAFARFLALKRGLDPELASIIGHLNDVGRIVHGTDDASRCTIGALEAERALRKTSLFSEMEISVICNAIKSQDAVGIKGGPYEELLKDAVLLEKYFDRLNYLPEGDEQNRLINIFVELNMA
ncbi:MAG: hypothetical protein ACM3X9_08045 [Bacillota bacterium]